MKYFGPSLLLAISSVISRLLGVYRDHLFALNFGASAELDAYYASFRIPDLLYSFLIIASISVVFLPMFQKYKEKNQLPQAWKFTSALLNSFTCLFLFLSVLIIILAPFIINIYVPNFSDLQKENTVLMMRIMMVSPLCFMLSSIMISVSNAFQKFFTQALSPVIYNLGIISGVLFFKDSFGIIGLSYGVLIGSIGQMLVQILPFFKTGFQWSGIFLQKSEIKKILQISLPRILSISSDQIILVIHTFLASLIGVGSISLLNLALNIQSFPYGVISVAISITAFASLTKFAALDKKKEFQKTLIINFEKTLFWLTPAVFGLFLVIPQLVKVLFEYGKFLSTDSVKLILLCKIFLLAVFFQGLIPLLSRAFFAYQKTLLVFKSALLGFLVNLLFSFSFYQNLGVLALAWGYFLAMLVNALFLLVLAWKEYGSIFYWKNIFYIFLISSLMFLFLYFFIQPLIINFSSLFQLILLSLGGGGFYLFFMRKKLKI